MSARQRMLVCVLLVAWSEADQPEPEPAGHRLDALAAAAALGLDRQRPLVWDGDNA